MLLIVSAPSLSPIIQVVIKCMVVHGDHVGGGGSRSVVLHLCTVPGFGSGLIVQNSLVNRVESC